MVYVPLTTQSAGQTASATGWANVVKSNFEAMGPHLLARKASDENVTSTTLQDDNDFVLPVAINEVWQIFLSLLIVTGAGGMKSSWSFPASGEMTYTTIGNDSGSTLVQQQRLTASDAQTVTYIASSTGRLWTMDGVYVNAGTAGSLIFRNALNTASGTSTVEANSTMWVVKLA